MKNERYKGNLYRNLPSAALYVWLRHLKQCKEKYNIVANINKSITTMMITTVSRPDHFLRASAHAHLDPVPVHPHQETVIWRACPL